MDNTILLQQTGRYIDDYLEAFTERGQESDIEYTHFGVPIHPSQIRMFEGDVEMTDQHSARFNSLQSQLNKAAIKDFREAVTGIEDVVVIDMCSWYGERFGLWVAAENPSAEVHVYDPQPLESFAGFLFNDMKPEHIFKFGKEVPYDVMHQEQSVNNLYRKNGLENITFHQVPMTQQKMEKIAEIKSGRKVVFTARRINDCVGPIAEAVSRHSNTEMIIAPLINLEVRHYQDDAVMQKIEANRNIRQRQDASIAVRPEDTARSRLFSAMQLHYSLKAATKVGRRAQVYRSGDIEGLSVFHQPTHYVSTIEPKKT